MDLGKLSVLRLVTETKKPLKDDTLSLGVMLITFIDISVK